MSTEMYETATTRFILKVEAERDDALRDLEHERQEAGRLRARVEELEAAARIVVELYVDADLTDTHPVWPLRLALGVDGATGARDVHEEVDRG